MIYTLTYILASFMAPVELSTSRASLLLALPLIAVIAVTYKATKLDEIKLWSFTSQCLVLFGSIVVFMALIAVGLFIAMRIAVG
jgi:hypothetical protein